MQGVVLVPSPVSLANDVLAKRKASSSPRQMRRVEVEIHRDFLLLFVMAEAQWMTGIELDRCAVACRNCFDNSTPHNRRREDRRMSRLGNLNRIDLSVLERQAVGSWFRIGEVRALISWRHVLFSCEEVARNKGELLSVMRRVKTLYKSHLLRGMVRQYQVNSQVSDWAPKLVIFS